MLEKDKLIGGKKMLEKEILVRYSDCLGYCVYNVKRIVDKDLKFVISREFETVTFYPRRRVRERYSIEREYSESCIGIEIPEIKMYNSFSSKSGGEVREQLNECFNMVCENVKEFYNAGRKRVSEYKNSYFYYNTLEEIEEKHEFDGLNKYFKDFNIHNKEDKMKYIDNSISKVIK